MRHQIAVLERQLGTTRPRFCPGDRAFLAALLHALPRDVLSRFRLLACDFFGTVTLTGTRLYVSVTWNPSAEGTVGRRPSSPARIPT